MVRVLRTPDIAYSIFTREELYGAVFTTTDYGRESAGKKRKKRRKKRKGRTATSNNDNSVRYNRKVELGQPLA